MLHLAAWLMSFSAHTTGRGASRARRSQAVSMLEYVLIAAVILVVVALFSAGFRSAVSGLVDRLTNAINTGQ